MLRKKLLICSSYNDPNYGIPPSLETDFSSSIPSPFTFSRASIASVINAAGNVVDYAVNAPRYIPGKGLLLESQSINCCSNPRHAGVVVGSPGTLPTNWSTITGGGINWAVVGAGVENGMEYFDLRLWATATTAASVSIFIDGTTSNISAPNGDGKAWNSNPLINDTWYIKTVGTPAWGPLLTGNNLRFGHAELNSAGTSAGNAIAPFTVVPNSVDPLTSQTFTRRGNMNAACKYARPMISLANMGAGLAYDVTFRIGHIQVEVGTCYGTTPIRPATVAVVAGGITRAGDSLLASSLGSWYNPRFVSTAISWYDLRSVSAGGHAAPLVSFDDGTGVPGATPYTPPTNYMQVLENSGGDFTWYSTVGGVLESALGGSGAPYTYGLGSGPNAIVTSFQPGAGTTNNYAANIQPVGYGNGVVSAADPTKFTRLVINEASQMYSAYSSPVGIPGSIQRIIKKLRYYPRYLGTDECHDIALSMALI